MALTLDSVVPLLTFAQQLEQLTSLGIFVVGFALAALSAAAWRRERDRRMLIVSMAYGLFALYGLIVFLEYYLVSFLPDTIVEIIEHGAALLVLVGLLAFFVAMTRE